MNVVPIRHGIDAHCPFAQLEMLQEDLEIIAAAIQHADSDSSISRAIERVAERMNDALNAMAAKGEYQAKAVLT